jgi:acetyl esterase/lipase
MKFSCVILSLFVCFSAQAQTFLLFEPPGGKAAKTVVFVHGGAWISGSAAQDARFGDEMKKAGLCAVAVDYRLAPEFVYPAQTLDLETVLQKLAKEKSKKCDFKKIYLVGFSAGSHIIADWAAKFERKSVKGFVGLAGIYDIPSLVKARPDFIDWFIKKEFGEEKNWAGASLTSRELKNKNPWLLVHSKKDELVGTFQSEIFHKVLERQKIKAKLLNPDTGSHGQTLVKSLEEIKNFVNEN